MTSKDLLELGIIDAVIPEPLGGAHRDHNLMASRLKMYLRNTLRELTAIPVPDLLEARYQKFRRMGVFLEGEEAEKAACEPKATASAQKPSSNGKPVAN
jgi:acetyl-CoA carboxylase carboxyl transferase subunit alpha